MEEINVLKYGFKIVKDTGKSLTYNLITNDEIVELFSMSNCYSLSIKDLDGSNEFHLAKRYWCNNQQQLDFLLLNGRAARFFNVPLNPS